MVWLSSPLDLCAEKGLISGIFPVVYAERLILWRSQIFGGLSNEISVILDESTLLKDMQGILFCLGIIAFFFSLVSL